MSSHAARLCSPHDPPAPDPFAEKFFTHTLPVDVALGKVDYLEVVGFSDHRVTSEVWSRLLNCGFRVAAAGGTDAMTNYASMRGPIGLNRTYVKLRNAPKTRRRSRARLARWIESRAQLCDERPARFA
ncbi:MAG: hypothetical protein R3C55_12340 [Parvularculaceae bacterium]